MEETREQKRARRLAEREALKANPETVTARARTQARARTTATQTERSATIQLMVGEITVGKATIQSDGSIIARIGPSGLGQAIYPGVKEGLITSLQLGAQVWPELQK